MANEASDSPKRKPTGDYPVGYCKPPTNHQFQPGQSGNPAGKPKGVKNLATLFREHFETKQPVKLKGKTVNKTPLEIAFMQIAQKAMVGDIRFVKLALALWQQHSQSGEDFSADDLDLDLQMLENFVKKQSPDGWGVDHDGK